MDILRKRPCQVNELVSSHSVMMDERFSYLEERWETIGQTPERQILVVINFFFDEDG